MCILSCSAYDQREYIWTRGCLIHALIRPTVEVVTRRDVTSVQNSCSSREYSRHTWTAPPSDRGCFPQEASEMACSVRSSLIVWGIRLGHVARKLVYERSRLRKWGLGVACGREERGRGGGGGEGHSMVICSVFI